MTVGQNIQGAGVTGNGHRANLRGVVTMLIDYLEVKETNARLINSLVDKVNLAQVQVVSDCRCLEAYDETHATVASTRSYNLVSTWLIYDLLAIRHLYVDGYEIFPLVNGFADMDLKNDTESNRIRGYYLEGGILYLEPIPSEALDVKLIYIRKPVRAYWEINSYLEVGDEYIEAVLQYAYAIYHPPGSPKRLGAKVEYDNMIQNLRVVESLRASG